MWLHTGLSPAHPGREKRPVCGAVKTLLGIAHSLGSGFTFSFCSHHCMTPAGWLTSLPSFLSPCRWGAGPTNQSLLRVRH